MKFTPCLLFLLIAVDAQYNDYEDSYGGAGGGGEEYQDYTEYADYGAPDDNLYSDYAERAQGKK